MSRNIVILIYPRSGKNCNANMLPKLESDSCKIPRAFRNVAQFSIAAGAPASGAREYSGDSGGAGVD